MPITPVPSRAQRLDAAANAALIAWTQGNRAAYSATALALKWLELREALDAVLP